jgi:vacuolar protein sorting-associated protein 13A/C
LGIQIQDGNRNSRWEKLRQISVDRAGEKVLTLRPRLDTVSHQIACEIKLENNVKIITFRSTLNVENQTSLPIEMIVVDSHGKASTGALRIDPGQSMPMPLIDAYEKRFRLRPLKGFNFDYSWSLPLHWRQLMSRPIRSISCKHQTPKEPAFFFQGQAIFDEKDPATR